MASRRESLASARRRAGEILRVLEATYPGAKCALDWSTPLQLAVATILSAQCTDKRVNLVTPALFARFPDAAAFAAAGEGELEEAIRACGFFRNKARSIRALGAELLRSHGGELPRDPAVLEALPGIGRKTGNLLAAELYGIPSLVVDTHFIRMSNRLGLLEAPTRDPKAIERRLQKLVPQEAWTRWSHLMVTHGRRRCPALKPGCAGCPVAEWCPSAGKAAGR